MDSELTGRRLLVTGASGGIGAATARLLASEGARLLLHYHQNARLAERLAVELVTDFDAEASAAGADLADEISVERLFVTARERLGGLDGLVANAGIWPPTPIPVADLPLDRWRRTLEVDLTGVFLSCRGFLRSLRETPQDDPAIVLVGSTAGLVGEEGHGDYAAAKAGLTGLLLTLKNEIVRMAPHGRVNLVAPGWVDTPMSADDLADPQIVARATATMALRKVATPEDVAAAVAFLLSPRLAGHLSGVVLPVHGGMEGRLLHSPAGRGER